MVSVSLSFSSSKIKVKTGDRVLEGAGCRGWGISGADKKEDTATVTPSLSAPGRVSWRTESPLEAQSGVRGLWGDRGLASSRPELEVTGANS